MDVLAASTPLRNQQFRQHLQSLIPLDDFAISFSQINTRQKIVSAISSDLDWHLCYWDQNLDLHTVKRLTVGITPWHNIREFKEQTTDNPLFYKVDICTYHGAGLYELLSIHSQKQLLTPQNLLRLLVYKARISFIANKIDQQRSELLPLRGQQLACNVSNKPQNNVPYAQFGDIRLTDKELETIHWLLQLQSVKEIAWRHQCSVNAERKRIANIKNKFHCANMPLSNLFKRLREQGVTLSCLTNYLSWL